MNERERVEHIADKLGRFFPFDSDGLHKEAAAELRRLVAINAELVQALERISKQPDWFKSQSIAKVVLKKAKK